MQISNLLPFCGSIYSSLQEKVSSVLNDKQNVLITLLAVSILAVLTVYLFIQRKAKFSKMSINIIDKDDQTTTSYKIEKNETVGQLKTRMSQKMHVPTYEIELRKNDLLLEDGHTFKDYGIQNQSTLTLIKGVGIFVQTPQGQTISYRVSENDTVGSFKMRLSQNLAPTAHLILKINDLELEDNKTFKDYCISTHSYIQLIIKTEQIKVQVRCIANPHFDCTMKRSDTVEALKKEIGKQLGCPMNVIHLSYDGQTLENDRILESYGMTNQPVIDCIRIFIPDPDIRAAQNIQVFVKTLTSKTATLQLLDTDKVKTLMKKIQQKEGIPLDQQRLIFNGVQLDKSLKLRNYNIQQDSIIHLILKLRGD